MAINYPQSHSVCPVDHVLLQLLSVCLVISLSGPTRKRIVFIGGYQLIHRNHQAVFKAQRLFDPQWMITVSVPDLYLAFTRKGSPGDSYVQPVWKLMMTVLYFATV